MTNEILFIFEALIALVIGMLAWNAKEFKQNLEDTKKELTDVRINYVHKEELKQFRTEVIDLLKEVRQDIKEMKER